MMPWGHFAVAFLPYLAYKLIKCRSLPSRQATIFLLVASQLPDLIDKPLAWSLHILPSGRSLGHSLLFAVPLVLVISLFATRRGRSELGTLFTFGYLSHVFGDIYNTLLYVPTDQWASTFVASLYWPLLPIIPEETMTFLPHFTRIDPTRYSQVGIGLVVFAVFFAYPEIASAFEKYRTPAKPAPEEIATATGDHEFNAD